MKKKLCVFLSLLLVSVMFLAACGGKTVSDGTEEQGKEIADEGIEYDLSDSSVVKIIRGRGGNNPALNRSNAANTLVVGMPAGRGQFHPLFAADVYDLTAQAMVFDGLFDIDENALPIPKVAKSWEYSNDNKTITFYLRDDVYFHDGVQLTAYDVEFTFTMLCDPSYDGRFSTFRRSYILGGQEYFEGITDVVEGIRVIDEFTIEFTYREANINNFLSMGFAIMPRHYYAYEKGTANEVMQQRHTDLMGSGPFKFVSYEPDQFVVFERNPNYFLGASEFERLIHKYTTGDTFMQEIETGGVDIHLQVAATVERAEMFAKMGFIDLIQFPQNSYAHITMNNKHEILQHKEIRQAIAWGLDRELIVELHNGPYGQVIGVPYSPVSWAFTENLARKQNLYAHSEADGGRGADIAKAKKLIESLGWSMGSDGYYAKDGNRLRLSLLASATSAFVNDTLLPVAIMNFQEIGIELVPELVDFGALVDQVLNVKEYDLVTFSWGLTSDPGSTRSSFHSDADRPGGNNVERWINPRVDFLVEEGVRVFDQAQREKIYEELGLIYNEEVPVLPLFQSMEWIAVNQRIDAESVKISPFVPFRSVAHLIRRAQ